MEGLKAINARRRVFARPARRRRVDRLRARRRAGTARRWTSCSAAGDAGLLVLVAGPDVVRIAPSLVISPRRNPRGPRAPRDRAQPRADLARSRAGTMFFVRPIARDDLPAVLALSERTGTGLTTLPANRERLAERIERSLASFAGTRRARRRVLRVRARRRRDAGASSASARSRRRSASNEPWYNYHVGTLVHASRALDVYTAAPTLFLANDHTGHTELCSLFLDQALPARQERPAAREEPPPVHRRVRRALRAEGDRRAARPARRRRQEPVLGRPRPALLRDGVLDAPTT